MERQSLVHIYGSLLSGNVTIGRQQMNPLTVVIWNVNSFHMYNVKRAHDAELRDVAVHTCSSVVNLHTGRTLPHISSIDCYQTFW